MQYDVVAEHGGEVSSSKSWNAECEVVVTWSCGSDEEGAEEVDV